MQARGGDGPHADDPLERLSGQQVCISQLSHINLEILFNITQGRRV